MKTIFNKNFINVVSKVFDKDSNVFRFEDKRKERWFSSGLEVVPM